MWHLTEAHHPPTNIELLVIYPDGAITVASVEDGLWSPHDCVTETVEAPLWWASLLHAQPKAPEEQSDEKI